MKKITHIHVLVAVLFLQLSVNIHAQSRQDTVGVVKAGIEVQARFKNGVVELRWAPNAHYTFSLTKRKGYAVDRYNAETKSYERLAAIRPYTLPEFKTKLDTANMYVTSAAQALWGKEGLPSNPNANPLEAAKLKAEEQNNRFVFAMLSAEYDHQAAVGLGLYFKDETAQPNKVYTYKVYALDVNPSVLQIDTAGVSLNTFGEKKDMAVTGVFSESFDGKIKLQWPKSENNSRYSGYFIERKSGEQFERLNHLPHISSDANRENIFNVFIDTAITNGVKYTYRILGINSFANVELPSVEITTQGNDLSGPIPPKFLHAKHLSGNEFTLFWEASTIQSDHDGFLVARAGDGMGPFEIITEKPLSTKTRQWVDENPPLLNESYYIVYAVDKNGNKSASGVAVGQWRDSIPPAKPTNLIGYSDSTGVVMLAWELGDEPDLYGYKVFAANAKYREFHQVNSLIVEGNVFLDKISLNTLTEDIFYYVTAFDFRYNASVHSDTLKLAKPDVIPPTPIVFKNYSITSDSISMEWAASSSQDVEAYYMLRKLPEMERYDVLQKLEMDATGFTDKTVELNVTYDYAVLAIDDAGLPSLPSEPLRLTCVDRMLRQGITDLSGLINEKEGSFELRWSAPWKEGIQIAIYRNDNDKGLEKLAQLHGDVAVFVDDTLYNNGGKFDYAVKLIYPDGGQSALSNVVTLKLE